MIEELVKRNRSYRRFYQEEEIAKEELLSLVDISRFTASGANRQPLRYKLSYTKEMNSMIFSSLRWAGYYQDWDGPVEGERPTGYIVILSERNVNAPHDEGIVAQTILLAATEKKMGGCILANIDREKIAGDLQIPENYVVKLVIALGYPKENVIIDEISKDEDIKYYRDENQNQHVPKIRLNDLLL